MIESPVIAMFITLILCFLWMRFVNLLSRKNILSSSVSRKIVHIGTGPLFLLCWMLFPDKPSSRFLAALVPLLIVVQISLIASGLLKDESSVKAMARSGNKKELIKGPLFYGLMFVVITILFWKTPNAIISLIILCVGDGVADLVGSRAASKNLFWSKNKTYIGSLSMFLGSAIFSILFCELFILLKIVPGGILQLIIPIVVTSGIATLVESITPSDFDNLTVPIASLIILSVLI